MGNHYHIVLNMRADLAALWPDREVVHRWHSLFSGNSISQRLLANEPLSNIQTKLLSKDIELWRARIYRPSVTLSLALS